MSMSFGQFDFDNALQNVSQAYRRASQVATEAASQASQAASQAASDFALWSAGQEPEEESESELDEDLPEVAAVRDLLRPVASVLLARHIKEHADLFSYVLTSKDEVGSCAGEMLFGRPEDGATMTRFWLRRKPSHGLQMVAGGLDQRPNEEELREEEHEQQISPHSGDAWLRILNLNDEPSILDFKVDAAHGCAPQALPEAMALFAVAPYALEVLLLAAFDQPKSAPRRRSRPSTAAYLTSAPAKKTCSSSRRVRHAATQLVPRIMAVLRRIVALKSMELGVNALADLDGSVNVLRVDAKVPLDFQALDKHYKRVGKLLKHYDLVSVKAYDHKTDACLFTFCIQDGWIHVCFHLMEGQLAWPSEGTRAAMPLTFGDGIKLDLEIQLSLLLMGLTLPAVALPKLFLEVVITAGNVQVVCQEAGEEESSESHHHAETDWSAQVMSSISSAAWAAAESAANLAYDFQLLRRLLKEKFFFNLSFEKGSENASGESVAKMRTAMELAIPKSAAAEVVTQCLKHFLTEQLKKMDLLTLFRDLLEAVGQDLSRLALSEEWNSMRYAQLQEEMQQAEQELAAIEQQEIAALSRLQRSQSVRESVVSQYHTEVAPRPASMAEMSTAASTREPLEEPPKLAGDLLEVERYVDDRNDLKETQEMPAQKQRSHQRSGSSGFAPVDLEPEEFPQSEPMPPMELPVEGEGDPSPRKREGVRPKQPRGYAFSPKTRRASAGPSQAKQAD